MMSHKRGANRSTVAQMAEWAPSDQKVPSSIPALDPMRCASLYDTFICVILIFTIIKMIRHKNKYFKFKIQSKQGLGHRSVTNREEK